MSLKPLEFVEVGSGRTNKELRVPTSKSHSNRMLILAACKKGAVEIEGLPESTDVLTMVNCMKAVGLDLAKSERGVVVGNSFPECEVEGHETITLNTGDGGTTNRFFMAFLARGKRQYQMVMDVPMRIRPMDDLITPLKKLNVRIDKNDEGYIVQGPLGGPGIIEVESSKSTQFVSALKMAVMDKPDIKVESFNLSASEKYYQMTLDLIDEFKTEKTRFKVPVDASSLGYAVAAGATLGLVEVTNCFEIDMNQADSAIFEILKEMGGHFHFDSGHLFVERTGDIKPIDVDCSGFPDLVPTLAYLCSCAEGVSSLKNLEILTYKESNRFDEILNLLKLFNIKHEVKDFDLYIHGTKEKCPIREYNPPADHRLIMVAYLFMKRNSGGKISNFSHVKKSFPGFFEVMG